MAWLAQRERNTGANEGVAVDAATREEELLVRYATEIARAVDSRCRPTVVLDPLAAVAVIGHLQFALRHVGDRDVAARMARRFAESLAGAFAEYPAVNEVIRRGWQE